MPPPVKDIHALIGTLWKVAIEQGVDPFFFRFKLDAVAVKMKWTLPYTNTVAEFAEILEYVKHSPPQFEDYPPTAVLTKLGIEKAKENAVHEAMRAPEKPKRQKRTIKPLVASVTPKTPAIPSMLDVIEGPPKDWRDLQERTAAILRECGFDAQTDVSIEHVRGTSDLDVRAEDKSPPPRLVICECKLWGKPVNKSTVHAFRTVVGDAGADTGYLISSKGFQSGAIESAKSTNVKLVTWEEFQRVFVDRWFGRYFLPALRERGDRLAGYAEPIACVRPMSREGFDLWQRTHERDLPVGAVVLATYSLRALGMHTGDKSAREEFFEEVERERNELPPEFLANRTLRDLLDYIAATNDRVVESTQAIAKQYPPESER